jgi:hypothetical protein
MIEGNVRDGRISYHWRSIEFEVLTAVITKVVISWNIAPSSLYMNRRFRGMYPLHHYGRKSAEQETRVLLGDDLDNGQWSYLWYKEWCNTNLNCCSLDRIRNLRHGDANRCPYCTPRIENSTWVNITALSVTCLSFPVLSFDECCNEGNASLHGV